MTTDQEKISKAQSLFLGNDPLSSWGRYLLTRLVDEGAKADRAEFNLHHCLKADSCHSKANYKVDPRHNWTQAQWQQAAKGRLGVE